MPKLDPRDMLRDIRTKVTLPWPNTCRNPFCCDKDLPPPTAKELTDDHQQCPSCTVNQKPSLSKDEYIEYLEALVGDLLGRVSKLETQVENINDVINHGTL